MSNKVTIDNLPPDAYKQWALDQQERELQDKVVTAPPTQVDALEPSYVAHLTQLFNLRPTELPWAFIQTPPAYTLRKDRVFADRMLAKLGSEEKLDYLAETIKRQTVPQEAAAYAWQNEQKRKKFDQDKNHLLTLLALVKKLDKVLLEINSKRRQYLKE